MSDTGVPPNDHAAAAPIDDPAGTILALDFDGTLAHIVDDPTEAYAHHESVAALGRLGRVLGAVTIITGRPVAQALELGGFADVPGLERLTIHGQYGAEHWDAAQVGPGSVPARPAAIGSLAARLPEVLRDCGAESARVEDKGLALVVHTRGLRDGAADLLEAPLRGLADDLGLCFEPGRQVFELRASASDKGVALRKAVAETAARTVVFAGDDLGDLPAFDAVDALRTDGLRGLLVCSASEEQDALVARADVVLDGPDEVAAWLTAWADALDA